MAYEETLRSISLDADNTVAESTGPPGVPGSARPNYGKQYRFVKIVGPHRVGLGVAAADPIVGVVQNKPQVVGEAATVAISGISMVFAGAALTAGQQVDCDANGAAVPTAGANPLGIAVLDAAQDELAAVLLRIN